MRTERRQSLRVVTRLPCQWQTFDTQPQRRDLIDCFGPSQEVARALRALDEEIEAQLAEVPDKTTRQLLTLLDRKINLLAPLAQPQAVIEVEVSADGLCLPTPHALAADTWVGLHLLIEDYGELLAPALVRHSTRSADGGYRTGVEIANEADRRPLARLVMRSAV